MRWNKYSRKDNSPWPHGYQTNYKVEILLPKIPPWRSDTISNENAQWNTFIVRSKCARVIYRCVYVFRAEKKSSTPREYALRRSDIQKLHFHRQKNHGDIADSVQGTFLVSFRESKWARVQGSIGKNKTAKRTSVTEFYGNNFERCHVPRLTLCEIIAISICRRKCSTFVRERKRNEEWEKGRAVIVRGEREREETKGKEKEEK